MREEEKASEYEKAKKEAEREEKLISQAIAKAQAEAATASAEDRAVYEAQMEQLRAQLSEAEAKINEVLVYGAANSDGAYIRYF